MDQNTETYIKSKLRDNPKITPEHLAADSFGTLELEMAVVLLPIVQAEMARKPKTVRVKPEASDKLPPIGVRRENEVVPDDPLLQAVEEFQTGATVLVRPTDRPVLDKLDSRE